MDSILHGLLDLPQPSGTPLVRRLTEQVRHLITEGQLRPGQRLPSSRAMALELGVSRNTVTQVIEQLAAEGYLEVAQSRRPIVAQGGSLTAGDHCCGDSISAPPRSPLSSWGQQLAHCDWPPIYRGRPKAFQPGLADEREFPHDIWGRCLRHAASRRLCRQDRAHNASELQQALVEHLAARRGIRVRARQIFIVPSAQAGLTLIARTTLDPGDVAWVESPGYGGAHAALRSAGAKVVGVPLDAGGITIDHAGEAPRLIFSTPSHQYPTGRLMLALRLKPQSDALALWDGPKL